jgi:hypothetical protein
MASALRDVLHGLHTRRSAEALASGQPRSAWVLFPEFGETPVRKAEARVVKRVSYAMLRTLKAAGLPLHYTTYRQRRKCL